MTEQTVPAILDSILEPLASILLKVNRALTIAKSYKLPDPFIQTITASRNALDASWESLQEIVTTLDPDAYKHKP